MRNRLSASCSFDKIQLTEHKGFWVLLPFMTDCYCDASIELHVKYFFKYLFAKEPNKSVVGGSRGGVGGVTFAAHL